MGIRTQWNYQAAQTSHHQDDGAKRYFGDGGWWRYLSDQPQWTEAHIRVLTIDDHAVLREGTIAML